MKNIVNLTSVLAAALLMTACQTETPKPETAQPAAANPTPTAPMPSVSAAPSAAAAPMPPAAEIIIDDKDPGFKSVGAWTSASGGHDYKDETVYAMGTGPTETAATATWTPDIKVAGDYDVYEWHGDDPNSDHGTNAPFTITYDGGSKTVPVNLQSNTGKWNLLGTFKFAAGQSGSVTLSSKASGNVIADAVRFAPHQ